MTRPQSDPQNSLERDEKGDADETNNSSNDRNRTFANLGSENSTTSVASMCMNCREEGTTTFLLTTVPYFKDLIISHFECPHCSYSDNGVQFASAQPSSIKITCKISSQEDLNRYVIKNDYAVVKIPELQLEIPAETQKGALTTVEGLLRETSKGLGYMQHVRREECPETYEAIERVISRLNEYADGKGEFTIVLEDLTGNSYISHVGATPFDDKKLVTTHQLRTKEQNEQIGFCAESSLEYPVSEGAIKKESPDIIKDLLDRKEKQPSDAEREAGPSKSSVFESIQSIDVDRIHTFPTHCFSCGAPGEERMINLSIPYFRDIVIMSFNCDHCGYRNNEVKSEGPISQFGRIIRLSVLRVEDLSRDLLKSSTAGLEIPEISLFVEPGSLGGRFTTVEGIIARIIESLDEQARMLGDSASEEDKKNWDDFFEKLRSLLKVEKPFTLILNDPIANSYIQSFTAPEPDPQIQEEDYVRSKEQDEMLGLDTMNTENYAEEDQKEEVC